MIKVKRIWINEDLKQEMVFVETSMEDGTNQWFEAHKYIIRREQS